MREIQASEGKNHLSGRCSKPPLQALSWRVSWQTSRSKPSGRHGRTSTFAVICGAGRSRFMIAGPTRSRPGGPAPDPPGNIGGWRFTIRSQSAGGSNLQIEPDRAMRSGAPLQFEAKLPRVAPDNSNPIGVRRRPVQFEAKTGSGSRFTIRTQSGGEVEFTNRTQSGDERSG
jgi:hypothetical protein